MVARCEADGVRARRIDVDYASHSAQIDAIGAEFVQALAGIAPRSSSDRVFLHGHGGLLDTAGLMPSTGIRNVRQTVQF